MKMSSPQNAGPKARAQYDEFSAKQLEWVSSLPEAVKPFYRYTAPNASTPLYRGPLRVKTEKADHIVDGNLDIIWEPSPQLFYVSRSDFPLELLTSLFDLPDPIPTITDVVPNPPEPETEAASDTTFSGHLTQLEMGAGQEFVAVTFQLINFVEYMGAWIRDLDKPYHGRLQMTALGWRVTIDARPDLDEVQKDLRKKGGYVATHCGRLEREDGSTFTRAIAIEMLEGLHWFLSFVAGSHCGPFLPVGFSPDGKAVWSRWGVPTVATWPPEGGWFDRHNSPTVANLFPGFLERWLDPFWRRVVYIGIGYYLDANVPRTVQRAIGLAQIVLELLVNAVLADSGLISSKDLKRAGRAITRLLEHYNIGIGIPDSLSHLRADADREGWKTGPWAVTALRNEIIHPKRGARERPFRVFIEAWKLILWYDEMALLAFFGFRGVYGSRLTWPRWIGQVEQVPWVKS